MDSDYVFANFLQRSDAIEKNYSGHLAYTIARKFGNISKRNTQTACEPILREFIFRA